MTDDTTDETTRDSSLGGVPAGAADVFGERLPLAIRYVEFLSLIHI